MFSVQYGGDPLLASETTMLTTVLSLATIPLITLILL
jgi:predicted permease